MKEEVEIGAYGPSSFIENFVIIAKLLLYDLLKENISFSFDIKELETFENII